jgi:hypothetical protein
MRKTRNNGSYREFLVCPPTTNHDCLSCFPFAHTLLIVSEAPEWRAGEDILFVSV